jgi:hypothetical protein
MGLTPRELERQIEADLDWRHAELAIFREMITPSSISLVRAIPAYVATAKSSS